MTDQPWLVLGASGFVGAAIVAELTHRALPTRTLAAPRLTSAATTAAALLAEAVPSAAVPSQAVPSAAPQPATGAAYADLVSAFAGVDVVVNAAGLATPGEQLSPAMTGANALLPTLVAAAARAAGVRRVIHLSSASVQGHRPVIDETPQRAPFSAYSRSKVLGEEALELWRASQPDDGSTPNVVTLRATSVQGPTRGTTASLVKVARSPLASVAAPGTAPTPVSSIGALAWFVAETGAFPDVVPPIVLQPWEGLSVSDVLTAAGGRAPRRLPARLCRLLLTAGFAVSSVAGERLHGPLRRVELMWFGQTQTPGWADRVGLVPPSAVAAVFTQARRD